MKNSVKKKQTLIKFSILLFIKTPPNFEPCNTRLLINAKKEKNKQINAKLTNLCLNSMRETKDRRFKSQTTGIVEEA